MDMEPLNPVEVDESGVGPSGSAPQERSTIDAEAELDDIHD
jgi:hypothetical protein